MRRKRIIFYTLAALFGAGLFVWFAYSLSPRPSCPGVAFIGLSPTSTNSLLAHFRITNSLGYRAFFGVAPVEIDSGAGWPTFPANVLMYEIPRGGVTNVIMVVPAGEVDWRLPVRYSREPNRLELSVHAVADFVGSPIPKWSSNIHRVYTTYVSPIPR